jgi:hypothetical protein
MGVDVLDPGRVLVLLRATQLDEGSVARDGRLEPDGAARNAAHPRYQPDDLHGVDAEAHRGASDDHHPRRDHHHQGLVGGTGTNDDACSGGTGTNDDACSGGWGAGGTSRRPGDDFASGGSGRGRGATRRQLRPGKGNPDHGDDNPVAIALASMATLGVTVIAGRMLLSKPR